MIIASDRHRTQTQNLEDCIGKLYALMIKAGELPKETSEEQKKKVATLKRKDKARTMIDKIYSSRKKADRR